MIVNCRLIGVIGSGDVKEIPALRFSSMNLCFHYYAEELNHCSILKDIGVVNNCS